MLDESLLSKRESERASGREKGLFEKESREAKWCTANGSSLLTILNHEKNQDIEKKPIPLLLSFDDE